MHDTLCVGHICIYMCVCVFYVCACECVFACVCVGTFPSFAGLMMSVLAYEVAALTWNANCKLCSLFVCLGRLDPMERCEGAVFFQLYSLLSGCFADWAKFPASVFVLKKITKQEKTTRRDRTCVHKRERIKRARSREQASVRVCERHLEQKIGKKKQIILILIM